MIKLIIKKYIRNSENVNNKDVREAYGVLSGMLGIICNLMLFVAKLILGILINSIAIISDACNNLSDLGTSVIAILGAKLSNRPPDKEHPHGHGRYEYIASLVVSFIIFAVGLKLLGSAIDKIVNPQSVLFNVTSAVVLVVSVLVKLWMFSYNKHIDTLINSSVNRAASMDSLNDVYATSAVMFGSVIGCFVAIPVDGIIGLLISVLIIYTGFKTAKDSVNLLLGTLPDIKVIERINQIVLSGENVKGIHDLKIHDYGPGRVTASIHVEVSENVNIVAMHSEIDKIELMVKEELDIDMVIHVDPVN